ncbi:MAG TPA: hypothetical protein VMF06_16065, partial [Candidatus Limnocylindria bacterium]|nr:hypothetical protein [Candidatus Limnocylindria bacterium]
MESLRLHRGMTGASPHPSRLSSSSVNYSRFAATSPQPFPGEEPSRLKPGANPADTSPSPRFDSNKGEPMKMEQRLGLTGRLIVVMLGLGTIPLAVMLVVAIRNVNQSAQTAV